MISQIIRTETELKILFSRTKTILFSVLLFVLSTYFISDFIFLLLNSPKLQGSLLLGYSIIILLSLFYIFLIFHFIYRGLKDTQDKKIEKQRDSVSINGIPHKIADIQTISKYEVTGRYSPTYYFAIEFANSKRQYLAIRLTETEALKLERELELFFSLKIKTKNKFFGH